MHQHVATLLRLASRFMTLDRLDLVPARQPSCPCESFSEQAASCSICHDLVLIVFSFKPSGTLLEDPRNMEAKHPVNSFKFL